MIDIVANAPAVSLKKAKVAASNKLNGKLAQSLTANMVNAANKNLKEHGSLFLQAIKKYIAANYNVDSKTLSRFITKYVKLAVVSGALVQLKGKSVTGFFKLSDEGMMTVAKALTSKKSTAAINWQLRRRRR